MENDKNRILNKEEFTEETKKIFPSVKEVLINGKSHLIFPNLEQCRKEFERHLQEDCGFGKYFKIDWTKDMKQNCDDAIERQHNKQKP